MQLALLLTILLSYSISKYMRSLQPYRIHITAFPDWNFGLTSILVTRPKTIADPSGMYPQGL